MLSVNMYTAAARMCMHVVYIGSANASARLVSTVQFDHKITGVADVFELQRCLCQQHILLHPMGNQTSARGRIPQHQGADQAVDGILDQLLVVSCCSLQSNG